MNIKTSAFLCKTCQNPVEVTIRDTRIYPALLLEILPEKDPTLKEYIKIDVDLAEEQENTMVVVRCSSCKWNSANPALFDMDEGTISVPNSLLDKLVYVADEPKDKQLSILEEIVEEQILSMDEPVDTVHQKPKMDSFHEQTFFLLKRPQ